MSYRELLYVIVVASLILGLIIERTGFLAPLDEPLEAILFLLGFFAVALLYAHERKTRLLTIS